jgi:UDP-glucuronate decarboxylase
MKIILVTGGAGFLGSNLCRRLINDGHKVICADNLSTGFKENIVDLYDDKNFSFIFHDIVYPFPDYLIKFNNVDEIYNLACPASPVHYQSDPIKTMQTNVYGAKNMLDLARLTGAKILQASTSEVYGDPKMHPQKENYWGNVNCVGIRSCYDEGKRAAEAMFFDYQRAGRVKIKVARIFNTYGPGMHPQDGRVVSNFIIQSLQGKPITIYGKGNQTRSFCYVDDLIEGLIALMNTNDDFIGPVNIGNPIEFTISDLAQLVVKLTKSKSKISERPLPEDDPKYRNPDISLANKYLKWNPIVGIEQGLDKTIKYFNLKI